MHQEWIRAETPVSYPDAIAFMEQRVADILAGTAPECIWLVEHPPLYTAGTSANNTDLIDAHRFPVYETGRGGEFTYHGPGQRIAYIMLNLKKHQQAPDIKQYVWLLEEWIIRTLAALGITGERREGRVGIWVVNPDGSEDKIAAIGIRVRKWVTYHGIALNVSPDLSHYAGIIPCGIKEHGVTSLEKLGVRVSMNEVDQVMKDVWNTLRHCEKQDA